MPFLRLSTNFSSIIESCTFRRLKEITDEIVGTQVSRNKAEVSVFHQMFRAYCVHPSNPISHVQSCVDLQGYVYSSKLLPALKPSSRISFKDALRSSRSFEMTTDKNFNLYGIINLEHPLVLDKEHTCYGCS